MGDELNRLRQTVTQQQDTITRLHDEIQDLREQLVAEQHYFTEEIRCVQHQRDQIIGMFKLMFI